MLDKSPNKSSVAVPNDLAAHWMPFTANRAFKKAPRMLAGAKDMFSAAEPSLASSMFSKPSCFSRFLMMRIIVE